MPATDVEVLRLGLGGDGVWSTVASCCLLDDVWESFRRWKMSRREEVVVVRNVGPARKRSSEEEALMGGNRIDGGMGGYVRM